MRCSEADSFSHAFVDGELAGVDRVAYEQHLAACDRCSRNCRLEARFKAAIRGHLGPRPVPEGLRRRIEESIAAAPPSPGRWSWLRWPRLLPAFGTVLALSAIVAAVRTKPPAVMEQARRTLHSAMPLDVVASSCRTIADWFRGKLDFPVKPPEGSQTACQGGRLVNVGERFAAYVVLNALGGHRIGLMMYDGDDEAPSSPLRRVVTGQDVFLVTDRGASTALFRGRDGLNYVVTSDLEEDALLDFVSTAFRR
jgi:anti-sigma factor RsiW